MVNGSVARWRPATAGFPKGSILGQVLINTFNKDTDAGIECTHCKLAGDTNLSSAVDLAQGRDAIQRGLEKVEMFDPNENQQSQEQAVAVGLGQT